MTQCIYITWKGNGNKMTLCKTMTIVKSPKIACRLKGSIPLGCSMCALIPIKYIIWFIGKNICICTLKIHFKKRDDGRTFNSGSENLSERMHRPLWVVDACFIDKI